MITFHTSLERIHLWIKTLDIFYYDFLESKNDLDIKWCDIPECWTDPNHQGNSIVIEVSQLERLQYKLTFFVTTGTIMVQGTEYMTFTNTHITTLKSISEKISAGMDTNNNEHADELNQTIVHLDTRDTLTFLQASALDMDDEAEDTSLTSVKSIITTDQQKNKDKVPVVDMVEFHNHEQFSRLESTLTKSIVGINNLQKENTQEILLAIGNLSTTLNQISANKGKDTTKIQEVLALKEKIQILESQLKIKEHQALLEKSQLEESVKRTQSILDLTREQFDQSLTISRKEADIQSTKLDEKNREIELFHSEVFGLRERLDKSQDEVIQLKMHISSISVSNTETFTSTEKKPIQFQESNKPNVLLIGTSNVKGVHETRLFAF